MSHYGLALYFHLVMICEEKRDSVVLTNQPIHVYPLLIREAHLDTFGHVNNATYLSLFEEARWDLITNNGFGLREVKTSGTGPVILEINIKYQKELKLREKVRIETQLLEVNGKLQTLRQTILNEQNESCTVAVFKFGLFDTKERKLIAPSPAWLKAINYVEEK